MISKLKKLFSFLSLVLLGLLFPIHFASANFVTDLILWLPSRTILLIVSLVVQLAIFLVGLAGSLLNWVLSPNFIRLSYTNPANNQVIETGLGITQGFVNMLLVLVLVYIAIATILRLAGYETKKLLVTFIIVALLVNFAPVICGLIVDASNIVMNFFIQDLKADAFGQDMGAKVTQISAGFDWTKFELSGAFGTIFQLLIMAGFLFYLSLILGIFTLIFILRYLAIWLLVILSPLAFVCYILPATRKYFEQWWQQFLAWTFIGVTCGFFLYLGLLMVSLVPTAITAPTTGQGGLFDPILPYFVSVVFLGLGIVFGLKFGEKGAAIGVAAIVRGAKGGGKVMGKRGWQWTKQGVAATGRAGESTVRAAARIGEKMQRTYQVARRAGVPRSQALGEAIWRRRPWRPAVRRKARRIVGEAIEQAREHPVATAGRVVRAVGKPVWAASKGVLSAVKDVAVVGTAAAFKIKLKKKGLKICPGCHRQNVAKSAKTCPTCGYDFE